ncbi:MAG: hypothetical protein LCH79_16055 [Proteobacteria bacterium]|nr:hypothetical protein [Pseudomonadota bacterium]
MITLAQLADEHYAAGESGGLVLLPEQVLDCALQATRHYAAHGFIASLTGADNLPAAGDSPPEQDPVLIPAYPVKNIADIDENTVVAVGEWSVINPLFKLYVERANAIRLEASRAMGLEPYGRSVSEVQQDITLMETETLPARAFQHEIVTVGA